MGVQSFKDELLVFGGDGGCGEIKGGAVGGVLCLILVELQEIITVVWVTADEFVVDQVPSHRGGDGGRIVPCGAFEAEGPLFELLGVACLLGGSQQKDEDQQSLHVMVKISDRNTIHQPFIHISGLAQFCLLVSSTAASIYLYLMGNILRRFLLNPFMDYAIRPLENLFRFFRRLLFSKKQPPSLHEQIDQSPRQLSELEEDPAGTNVNAGERSEPQVELQLIEEPRKEEEAPKDDELVMTPQDQLIFDSHNTTISRLATLRGINAADLDEMAHSYTQVAILCSKYANKDYKKCMKSACNIYDAAPGQYFEERITLLNNVALHLQAHQQYAQAIQLYQEAIRVAVQYMSIGDHRAIIIKNNLACALIAKGDTQKGQEILQRCAQIAKSMNPQEGLTSLISNNINFHNGQPNPASNLLSDEICS